MTKTIGFDFDYGASASYSDLDEWQRSANPYTITLRYSGRVARFDYFTGPAITDDPTLADVMECLVSDVGYGQESFEEFCYQLGYNTDSRKAYKGWQACQATAHKLERLLGSDYADVVERFHP